MGASAGTGVRSFAEGGSTSAHSGNSFNLATINQNYARGLADPSSVTLDTSRPGLGGGFGGINPEAIRADSRAFGIGPAAQSLQRDLAREQAPQRQIYQAQYDDYGLGATPQARGFLGSILNPSKYGNLMPTFNRPQMDQQLSSANLPGASQPAYRIPYGPPIPQRSGFGLFKGIGGPKQSPEQEAQSLARDIQRGELTYAMYESMMADPNRYLPFVQDVQAGNTPTSIGYRPTPIQYMTAAQRDAYNAKQSQALSELLGPAPVDPSTVDSGGG